MGAPASGILLFSYGCFVIFRQWVKLHVPVGVAAAPAVTALAWLWPFSLYQHQEDAVILRPQQSTLSHPIEHRLSPPLFISPIVKFPVLEMKRKDWEMDTFLHLDGEIPSFLPFFYFLIARDRTQGLSQSTVHSATKLHLYPQMKFHWFGVFFCRL